MVKIVAEDFLKAYYFGAWLYAQLASVSLDLIDGFLIDAHLRVRRAPGYITVGPESFTSIYTPAFRVEYANRQCL